VEGKRGGVWGGGGHASSQKMFDFFHLEMAYFGGFLGTNLIIFIPSSTNNTVKYPAAWNA